MKIVLDHQIFTHQIFGGVSRYYSILANELYKSGQDVKILAGIHRNHYLSELPTKLVSGIKVSNYPNKTGNIFNFFNYLNAQMMSRIWSPDIIHETYYSSFPVFNKRAARITTVYDMIHELFKKEFSPRDNTSAKKKKSINRVDHIISISESTKNDLINLFGVDEKKISVVHLGVDYSIFEANQVKPKNETFPYILYVGNRDRYKNFSSFLKACSISNLIRNNIKLIAFGGGDFKKEEIALIKDLGFKNSFVEQVNGDDKVLASLYSNAICFVYPSLYEGFGLPPLEAMASGCPVVSSNTSSMPEIINNAGEFFDPYDLESIRFALEKVIFSEEVRNNLILKGFENIKNFSWEKCVSETLSIYKKISSKQ